MNIIDALNVWLQGTLKIKAGLFESQLTLTGPGLNVNWSIMFSCIKMFFISNIWCRFEITADQN